MPSVSANFFFLVRRKIVFVFAFVVGAGELQEILPVHSRSY